MKSRISLALGVAMLPAVLMLTSCKSTPDVATPPAPVVSQETSFDKGTAGGRVTQTVEMTATVTAVDLDRRTVTVIDSKRREYTGTPPNAAAKLDKVKVGDQVKITVKQELTAARGEAEAAADNGSTAVVAGPAPDARAGGAVSQSTQTTAKLLAMDPATRMASLQFANGSLAKVVVRPDVDMSRYSVGDTFVLVLTEVVTVDLVNP